MSGKLAAWRGEAREDVDLEVEVGCENSI